MVNTVVFFILIVNVLWSTWTYSNPVFFNVDSRLTKTENGQGVYLYINRMIAVDSITDLYK